MFEGYFGLRTDGIVCGLNVCVIVCRHKTIHANLKNHIYWNSCSYMAHAAKNNQYGWLFPQTHIQSKPLSHYSALLHYYTMLHCKKKVVIMSHLVFPLTR